MNLIKIKKSALLRGLQPQMAIAFQIAAHVYHMYDYDCVLTSGSDGKHQRASLHYPGFAIDLRTKHLPNPKIVETIAAGIREYLSNEYDVVISRNCLHIEYQPK